MTTADALAAGVVQGSSDLLAGIASDLDLLIRLHDRELDAEQFNALRAVAPRDWFSLPPHGPEAEAAFELLQAGLRWLDQGTDSDGLDDLAADFAGLYLTHSYRASPNESVWITEDGLERQDPMFAVRAWYRRYDMAVPDWRIRSDDHLVSQLTFVAHLVRVGTRQSLVDAGHFLDEHLLRWLRDFGAKAAMNCQTPFYAGLALISVQYMLGLRENLEVITGQRIRTASVIPIKPAAAGIAQAQPFLPGSQESW